MIPAIDFVVLHHHANATLNIPASWTIKVIHKNILLEEVSRSETEPFVFMVEQLKRVWNRDWSPEDWSDMCNKKIEESKDANGTPVPASTPCDECGNHTLPHVHHALGKLFCVHCFDSDSVQQRLRNSHLQQDDQDTIDQAETLRKSALNYQIENIKTQPNLGEFIFFDREATAFKVTILGPTGTILLQRHVSFEDFDNLVSQLSKK